MFKQISVGLAALGATAVGTYALVIRPWHLHWGATEKEAHQPMPGDAWIPHPKMESTRAIAIRARRADIWPWLVQMGTGRAGWYSYAWLENLLPSSAIIVPFTLVTGYVLRQLPSTGFEFDSTVLLALSASVGATLGTAFFKWKDIGQWRI
jgi:hypothetical protein